MEIRRYQPGEEEALSQLVRRNFLEVNSRDYPMDWMHQWADSYTPARIAQIGTNDHLYVAYEGATLVGTGAISLSGPKESMIETLFVLPERQQAGVGRQLLGALESDAWFLKTERTFLHASITARVFYEKMGYRHPSGFPQLIDEDYYLMEKRRQSR